MADEKATTAAAPATATAAKPASAAEPAAAVRYSYEELRDASNALFGYGPEVMDGAFYGKDKSKAYTVNEARDAVTAFLEKPVKEDK